MKNIYKMSNEALDEFISSDASEDEKQLAFHELFCTAETRRSICITRWSLRSIISKALCGGRPSMRLR